MSEKQIFVGRKKELERFNEVLRNPRAHAVLVVGQTGMGKTWLVNKMAELTENHPTLRCGCVRYEVTPTDSVDSTMTLILDNVFEAAKVKEKSLDGTDRRLEQWRSFLNVFNIGDLVMSLRRDPARNTREQFLERLELISKRLPNNGRAIFIIDPEKYMQKESDQSWAIVIKNLPDKIKLMFAQRPEDELVRSETFGSLKNVVHIPENDLDVLSDEDVDDLVKAHSTELSCSIGDLKKVLMQYKGHPYAVGAAIDLVKEGVGLEDLPKRPEPIKFAEKQWEKICEKAEAVKLFEAYAILEVGVPDDVVEFVSGQKSTTRKCLQSDRYLGGLLRLEGYGRRIYHAILADYILNRIDQTEIKQYHARAVEVYRAKLKDSREKQTKPDALAAMRLPEHVLAGEGPNAFVEAFASQCFEALLNAGLLDAAVALSQRALGVVEKGSVWEGALWSNLGLVYRNRGDLDEAEDAHKRSLDIVMRLGRIDAVASVYAGLGLVYEAKGNLDGAEKMHLQALQIEQKIGRVKGVAHQYLNLGKVYGQTGRLDKAEEVHKNALDIHATLGNQHGMAANYGNLGLIYRTRGDLDKAETAHRKSLAIADRLGLKQLMASDYANLALIYMDKREFDKAEEVLKKSLQIGEKLALQEVTANSYGNLGAIYEQRGDVPKAREYWEKALEIFKKIGMPHMVKKIEGWIEGLNKGRNQ